MKIRNLFKKKQLELHVLEPEETWYERSNWLALLARELKAEVVELREQNAMLLSQVNAGEPLTIVQEEFLHMRNELNELHKAKAKADNSIARSYQINRSLMDEIEDIHAGTEGEWNSLTPEQQTKRLKRLKRSGYKPRKAA
ncbi:MAG: hypothetical protein IPI00_15575 [Flavobacteriales bacterium]|nr:hypothetical protein [Flavobacteriales bacterium]